MFPHKYGTLMGKYGILIGLFDDDSSNGVQVRSGLKSYTCTFDNYIGGDSYPYACFHNAAKEDKKYY